jgi:hypothetical protein
MTHRHISLLTTILFVVHIAVGLSVDQFTITGDGPEYLRMAENLLDGKGFSYDGTNPVIGKPPGFSFLVAAYLTLFGTLTGFHFFQLLLLFLGYISIAKVAGNSFGHTAGLLVLTLLVAVDPIRDLAANLMSEPAFLALLGSGMLALYVSLKRNSIYHGIAAGALFGLATYVRPISLFWPIIAAPIFWLVNRRCGRIAVAFVIAHLLIVGPWIVRNFVHFDRVVPMVANWGPMYGMTDNAIWTTHATQGWVGGFQNERFASLIGSDFAYNWAPQERLREATLSGIRADVTGWIRRCLTQSIRAWTYVPGTKRWEWQRPALYWLGRGAMMAFFLACLLGFVFYWKRDPVLNTILVGQALYTGLMLFPVTVESRYLIPVYFCLMPLAVTGVLNRFKRFNVNLDTAADTPNTSFVS